MVVDPIQSVKGKVVIDAFRCRLVPVSTDSGMLWQWVMLVP